MQSCRSFFQAPDATWQAYNVYGGNSLYVGATSFPNGHAAKVSYNRPFITRAGGGGGGVAQDWVFNALYPMIRFMERNGYDLSYTTNTDAARYGSLILNHKVFLSVGHDEYWSAQQRTNVEAARNAGVHLAFFSGMRSTGKRDGKRAQTIPPHLTAHWCVIKKVHLEKLCVEANAILHLSGQVFGGMDVIFRANLANPKTHYPDK